MSGYPYSYSGPLGGSMRFKKRKSRFTFREVQLLLTEVKRNRHILVGKFNQGVSSDIKKRTWATLTARINEISECHREIIEVIKKWSDLKCDTKRKVAAMRASGFSASRVAQDLSPIETMVHQILQMPVPAEKSMLMASRPPDKDEDSRGALVVPLHSPGMANGRLLAQMLPVHVPPPLHPGTAEKVDQDLPLHDSTVPLTDFHFEQSGIEDQGPQICEGRRQSDPSAIFHDPPSTGRDRIKIKTQHQVPSDITVDVGIPSCVPPLPSLSNSGTLQVHLSKSASLSLQEQQATTALMGALSRSLESLSESVQQLAQTQQEFARDTLRLQRDALHVLRDFSSSALALMQDKVNGHP
ncbi:uncharacterized protein zgc:113149 isoform X2 [Electrophorus electricus]|uniref:Myb/SANT-like DNA-binding domain-containing protein n=1 Tax=Electrophorus electricus TaxID=8005 RepID=A0A4W4GQC9_ELEEL|nr:uncharacterized protein zgc:113149 isoform X2 [Electrophorus electricus]